MSFHRAIPVLLATVLVVGCSKKSETEAPATQPAAQVEASAVAPAVADANVREFTIGTLKAVALKDGNFTFPNDAKNIGVGHSPEEIGQLLSTAGQPSTELALSVQPLLVTAGDKVLLFDTGSGSNTGASGGKLPASLQQAGINPATVTDIFISHVHGDHVGGLVDANGALVFPNATIHLAAPEWEFLKGLGAEGASKMLVANYTALIGGITPKIDAFAPGGDIIPGIVKAIDIKGHTPGHSGYLITSGADSLLYIGDTAHHFVVSVQEPEWTIAFDGDAPTAQASRKQLIEQSAATSQRIYAVHFPFPGVGKFEKSGEVYVWVPEAK